MGEGKTPPAVPSSHPPPPAEVRPQGSPAAEVTDVEQLNGGGGGLVSADTLRGRSGGRDLENVRLGDRWQMRMGLGRRAGLAPVPPPGRKETPPTAREESCPAADAELSAPLGSPGCWVGAGRWGQGGGAGAFLLRAKEGEVEEEGREGEAEEALTTLRL